MTPETPNTNHHTIHATLTVADLINLPDKLDLTLSVEQAGNLCGIGRSKAYEEARRFLRSGGTAGLPTIDLGGSLRCPTAAVLRLLGLDLTEEAA